MRMTSYFGAPEIRNGNAAPVPFVGWDLCVSGAYKTMLRSGIET